MKPWILAFILITPLTSWAQTQWQPLGEGTARWGLFKLYDATLLAPKETTRETLMADETPLKLKLCYARSLTVDNFVTGANHVLAKQTLSPALQQAVDQLHAAYQAVDKGDCYVLLHQPEQGTSLVLNDQTLTTLNTPGFKAVYFGIWLREQPLSEALKNALLENI
ncbi:chalcone isomerase family protein [Thiomicrospira microaerophila]|uniref:chalcone isomerase family protein n=1 Tax=Thiomicrospira microaerophila TaxID=406020 RepID=UPI00200BCC1C|nr:chalcone isomerase family protein [Thiomicrospira microaerophila]UQB42558.1 chalcone isomerase family protein [Thiomicrospira microaerophila]